MREIFEGYEYGIDFQDAAGTLVGELTFGIGLEGEAARDAAWQELADNDDDPRWPETAVHMNEWKRPHYRPAVYGVDYGPGSVKARFGGGRVPRGAHQFRG